VSNSGAVQASLLSMSICWDHLEDEKMERRLLVLLNYYYAIWLSFLAPCFQSTLAYLD